MTTQESVPTILSHRPETKRGITPQECVKDATGNLQACLNSNRYMSVSFYIDKAGIQFKCVRSNFPKEDFAEAFRLFREYLNDENLVDMVKD